MIEPQPKRTGQAEARRRCFLAHSWLCPEDGRWKVTCYACGEIIDAAESDWIAEHMVLYRLTRDNRPSNVWPSCPGCAAKKTARDLRELAKTKRLAPAHAAHVAAMAAKAGQGEAEPDRDEPRRGPGMKSRPLRGAGAKLRSAPFQKGSRPMPGSKASGIRRRMSGRVEPRRDTH